MSFTLEEILPPDQVPKTVQSHDGVDHALRLMQQHGFDQLPVVNTDGISLKQVITYQAIIQGLLVFNTTIAKLQVRDVAKTVRTYRKDADLLDTLDDIQRHNFAFIVDEEEKLTGVVTTADTTVFFRAYAQDLMRIEGIEESVKEAIQVLYCKEAEFLTTTIESVTDRTSDIRKKLPSAISVYLKLTTGQVPEGGPSKEAIAAAIDAMKLPKPGKEFDMLSFDEFVNVLLKHPGAPKLANSDVVDEVRYLFSTVRDARNRLAHFRGELTMEERTAIQVAEEWLERNTPTPPEETIAAPPSPESVAPPVEPQFEEQEGAAIGSYAQLGLHLSGVPQKTNSITLTFAQVEGILGKELPSSAYDYRAWWANDPTKPQSSAWLEQGWRTTGLSLTDQRLTFVRTSERQEAYITFFGKLNARLEIEQDFPLRGMSPQGQNWFTLAALDNERQEAANINAVFTARHEFRIELYIDYGSADKNKRIFDALYEEHENLDAQIGWPLHWERLNEKRACRVAAYIPARIFTHGDDPKLLEWAVKRAVDFRKALAPLIERLS